MPNEDVAAEVVEREVGCSYCGAAPEAACAEMQRGLMRRLLVPHAQRWLDYWRRDDA